MIWEPIANIAAALCIGLVFAWVHRKLVAKMQKRVGPPMLQPVYDILKLLSKQRIRSAADFFVFLSLVFVAMAASAIPLFGGGGDVILFAYALATASVMLVMVGFATRSPYTVIGASRELQQTFFIEFAFLALVLSAAAFAKSTAFSSMLAFQEANPFTLVFVIGFVLSIPIMQAKLRLRPFDTQESHSEVVHGVDTELSGFSLALLEASHVMELFIVPFAMVSLFAHTTLAIDLAVSVVVLALLSLIEATSARLRPDQCANALLVAGVASVAMLALGGLL